VNQSLVLSWSAEMSGETTHGSSIVTMCHLMHRYLFVTFGQYEHNCASSATLLTWPGFGRFFLISQTEIHFERMTILDDSREYRKYASRATHNP
jgi:hypothetical protein